MIPRKDTRRIMVGGVAIGGGAPVTVQSMTNTDTRDVRATCIQVEELVRAGCDIVRISVPDAESATAIKEIAAVSPAVPIIADLHFDWRVALQVIDSGVAGIRLNPGTIANRRHVLEIARRAAAAGIAVRVGVNAGSLERGKKGAKGTQHEAVALAESALEGADLIASQGVENLKISVKASDPLRTIIAYRTVAERTDWPLHLGVTEAGTAWAGTIKSAVGIGALLAEGIGDTIRVSLTAPPVEEVRVGQRILASLGLCNAGPEIISCPTCARAEYDVFDLATRVEAAVQDCRLPLRIAVMGCAVNGPGEARDADIGVAGGKSEDAMLFVGGKFLRRIEPDRAFDELMIEISCLIENSREGEGA